MRAESATRAPIRLAGAVLWRQDEPHGRVVGLLAEAAALPFGQVDSAETDLEAAVRHARAVSGGAVEVGAYLGTCRGMGDDQERPRLWSGWAMRAAAAPADTLQWLPPPQAQERLAQPGERELMARFATLPETLGRVVLLRHAEAQAPSGGPDEQRQLNATGRPRAARLASVLQALGADTLWSSPAQRCQDTLAPGAAALGLDARIEPRVGEDADPGAVVDELEELGSAGRRVVVCSHAPLIAALLERFAMRRPELLPRPARLDAGGAWAVEFSPDGLHAMSYLPPPPLP